LVDVRDLQPILPVSIQAHDGRPLGKHDLCWLHAHEIRPIGTRDGSTPNPVRLVEAVDGGAPSAEVVTSDMRLAAGG
jgi:hypothetical protein